MKFFNNVNFDEWQEIVNKCEYSTFFHTPNWSKIFTETYPGMKIETKKFVLDDQTKVILPLISAGSKIGLFGSYFSNIAGVYGGVISERKITKKEISEIFTFLIGRNIARVLIVGNPFFDYILPEQFRVKVDFTHILKLSEDKEKLWVNYSHGARQCINKAKKSGVVCRIANNNTDEWKKYYSIYQKALKRWGDKATSHYPFSLFENMIKLRDPNIKLWLAIFDNKVVGGSLNFYHNGHCVVWHASFLSDYFKYGISNFLYHNIILDAKEKGYKYYDFNPSGGHEGTANFKEAFGSERLPVQRWEWENPFIRIITSAKRKIIGRAVSLSLSAKLMDKDKKKDLETTNNTLDPGSIQR